ncbi:MAG: polyphosphate kinase 1 [Bacteroidota bacterium]
MKDVQYIKRDVSWLSFNHRVLQEAMDERVPLYERIKFLAIYSSNLDEFFRVRVAALRSFRQLQKKTRKALLAEVKPKKQLKQIRKIVHAQQEQFGTTFRNQIIPALEQEGIFLVKEDAYTPMQQEFVRTYFFEKVFPILQPTIVKPTDEPPFLLNKQLYFIVSLEGLDDIAVVKIPSEEFPRFIELPADDGNHYITFLDDIIRFNLDRLLHHPHIGAYAVKLSRDAELYIGDEYAGDLVAKIRASLDDRNIGLPTRFLYDSSMPEEVLARLKQLFGLTKNDAIPGARYHNFNDFFGFPNPTKKAALHDPNLPPLEHPILAKADNLLECIRQKDQVLHFPYQRYDYIPKLIWEAADDPQVEAIRVTLYRVASKSEVVQALLHAVERGKQVFAFIEAKARFDEASNLYWGDKLQEMGAEVQYSYPGIKVHSKLLQIIRKEEQEGELKRRYYTYIGTGNFNEKTAKLYGDHALLTYDQQIGREVGQVFDLLNRKIMLPKSKHLLVAPFTLQQKFEECIDKEIRNAKKGRPAYMILKMNSLEERRMINKLYEASQAGVKIQLIVRGICCLVPGIPGVSDTIEITSIVDRFLEHARVYLFCNNEEEQMYIASADWMNRNLYRRVEVAVPIYDSEVFKQIRQIIDFQLHDNVKARVIDATQINEYKNLKGDKNPQRAQVQTYAYLQQLLKDA